MYSRSRMAGGEDRYTENLPPVYNGNRFSYARRDVNSPPPEEHKAPVISETEEAELACEAVADAEESHPAPTPQPGGIFFRYRAGRIASDRLTASPQRRA